MEKTELKAFGHNVSERLAGIIQFKTISYTDLSKIDFSQFDGMHEYLEQAYPLIHNRLIKETDEARNLSFFWEGTNKELPPIALLAHQDVVPVNEEKWSTPPFSGEIRDGYVYGRGSIDMKGQLISVMESVETLLQEGFVPERSIYLLFGADEEPLGDNGAVVLSGRLKEKGVRLHFVLDEGCLIRYGNDLGIERVIAPVSICEKGVMNLRLTAKGTSGHASMPPRETAVEALAKAINSLERHPMKSRLNYPVIYMIKALSPHMKGCFKFLFSNSRLFGGIIKSILGKSPDTAALLHTTFAPTQLSASNAPNVLADSASVVFNIRIAPGEDKETVFAHIDRHAKDLEKEILFYNPPSPVSSIDEEAYRQVSAAIEKVFPEMIVSPYMLTAATDSRHFYQVCDNVYRFSPFPSLKDDRSRMHGDDERLNIESLERGVEFYRQLIRTVC